MKRALGLLLLMMSVQAFVARAEDRPCIKETEPLMTTKATWTDISRAAAAMPPACFDGYFGEGISGTIERKSTKDWAGFVKELTKHSAPDDRFLVLVLRSINATLNPDDIKAMSKLARESCPSSLKGPCAAILVRARIALAEYDNTPTDGNP
jgi:hypothetical protein